MSIASEIAKKYPQKAAEAERGCDAIGSPIVSRNAKGEVVSVHQKYRLSDGTVVPLDYVEPPKK